LHPSSRARLGATYFRHASKFGLEGFVSKRRDRPWCGGPSKHWLNVKNPRVQDRLWEHWRLDAFGPILNDRSRGNRNLPQRDYDPNDPEEVWDHVRDAIQNAVDAEDLPTSQLYAVIAVRLLPEFPKLDAAQLALQLFVEEFGEANEYLEDTSVENAKRLLDEIETDLPPRARLRQKPANARRLNPQQNLGRRRDPEYRALRSYRWRGRPRRMLLVRSYGNLSVRRLPQNPAELAPCSGPGYAGADCGRRGAGSVTRAGLSIAVALLLISSAASATECQSSPGHDGKWWSYRIVDSKRCWYQGRPGRSKDLLHWAKQSPPPVATRPDPSDSPPPAPPVPPLKPPEIVNTIPKVVSTVSIPAPSKAPDISAPLPSVPEAPPLPAKPTKLSKWWMLLLILSVIATGMAVVASQFRKERRQRTLFKNLRKRWTNWQARLEGLLDLVGDNITQWSRRSSRPVQIDPTSPSSERPSPSNRPSSSLTTFDPKSLRRVVD
jgi:hypothetical protein